MRPTDIQRLADEEVMVLLRDGNPDAFEVIYDRHGGAAFSLAYRMVGDRNVAEDITQEAFLSIWRSRVRFDRERGSVRTWVLGIVHHRTIDALRRNVAHDRRRTSAEGLEERQEAPERTEVEVARRDEAREVREAMRTLPGEQLEVVRLAYFGGFTHTQIAQMLGQPVGTVKGRMRLGLEKMRRALAPEELTT
ncbi:MAG TPA: sigma-70 family RNA polymerase sigma factor [Kofleriaceae bacterium]|nr:sigma-70 family RNA polymerase sigma factor [Kofleriaceae bacterium]